MISRAGGGQVVGTPLAVPVMIVSRAVQGGQSARWAGVSTLMSAGDPCSPTTTSTVPRAHRVYGAVYRARVNRRVSGGKKESTPGAGSARRHEAVAGAALRLDVARVRGVVAELLPQPLDD